VFLFLAGTLGASLALGVLAVGHPFRAAASLLDRFLFPRSWEGGGQGGPLRMLAHCPACLSFWIALALSFWIVPFRSWSCREIVERILLGLSATAVTWVVHVVLTKLGQYNI